MEQQDVYKKVLAVSISNILLETGFDSVEKDALGILTEMLQCFLCKIGLTSKVYCEISGRNQPIISDIILGFVEMGINFGGCQQYIKNCKRTNLPVLQLQRPLKKLNMLQTGTKQVLPNYIPRYFQNFPDPHTYIRTPTYRQPVIDYETIRERKAIQKKNVERALIEFLCKTTPSHSLFGNDETNIFPLIACKENFPPYLSALLPRDQIFDEEIEYDDKHASIEIPKNQLGVECDDKMEIDQEDGQQDINKSKTKSLNCEIDNPYLADIKLPTNKDV